MSLVDTKRAHRASSAKGVDTSKLLVRPARYGKHDSRALPHSRDCRTSTFSLPIALQRINSDPEDAAEWLRRAVGDAETSARMATYIVAAAAYGLAERLNDDESFWHGFKDLAFWAGCHKLGRSDVLRHALLFVYGQHKGPVAARARDHARALQGPWCDGMLPQDLPAFLVAAGGFAGAKGDANLPQAADRKPASGSARLAFRSELLCNKLYNREGDSFWIEVTRERLAKRKMKLTIIRLEREDLDDDDFL